MPQAPRPALVARGDLLLGARLALPVERHDAGVVARVVGGQVLDQVLWQLALQLKAGDEALVGAQPVLDVAAVPDDGVDLRLHALQGGGEGRLRGDQEHQSRRPTRGAARLPAAAGCGAAECRRLRLDHGRGDGVGGERASTVAGAAAPGE